MHPIQFVLHCLCSLVLIEETVYLVTFFFHSLTTMIQSFLWGLRMKDFFSFIFFFVCVCVVVFLSFSLSFVYFYFNSSFSQHTHFFVTNFILLLFWFLYVVFALFDYFKPSSSSISLLPSFSFYFKSILGIPSSLSFFRYSFGVPLTLLNTNDLRGGKKRQLSRRRSGMILGACHLFFRLLQRVRDRLRLTFNQ